MSAPAARREEMAQLVDEDRPAEKQDDEKKRPGIREQCLEGVGRHEWEKLRFESGEGRRGGATGVGIHG